MTTYDEWKLAGPDEENEIGTEEGDICGRYAEPDEDAPRGYRPRPCTGTMVDEFADVVTCDTRQGRIYCDTCGATS